MDDVVDGQEGCGVERSAENDEESDYSRLTLLEKRNRNIERNKNFFLSLFSAPGQEEADSSEIAGVEKKCEQHPRKIEGEKLASMILEEEKRREDIVTSLAGLYPHRRDELQKLIGYLHPDFVPAPALLVHGPTGTGKSNICGTMLEKMYPHTYARVSCDSFHTSKQLLKAIWTAIVFARYEFENRNADSKSLKNFELYPRSLGLRTPSTFGDLAAMLGPFLDSFLGCKNSFYSTHNISREVDRDMDTAIAQHKFVKVQKNIDELNEGRGFSNVNIFGYNSCDGCKRQGVMHLLLDRIDSVEKLEKGLTNGLLCISEVIATLINLPLRMLPCTPMEFIPYPEKQLREILVSMATRAGFSKQKPVAAPVAAVPAVSGIATTPANFSNDLDAYSAVIVAVLPQFLLRTRHVSDLWEMSMSLWGFIFYSSKPSQYIFEFRPASLPSSATTINVSSSSAPPVARFQLVLKALKLAAQDVLMMPAIHVTAVQEPRKRRTWSGRETSVNSADTEQGKGFTRLLKHHKQLDSDIESGGGVEASLRSELLQAMPEETSIFLDMTLLKSREWCSTIPLSEKYLLVAAYIASVNRKETDDLVFAGKQQGRRKKVAAGHDDEDDAGGSSAARASGYSISRPFTVDRLASIFAQIASTGGVEKLGGGARAAIALGHGQALTDQGEFTVAQIATSYGDSDLFASIKGMEQRNLLIKAGAWTLERPMYTAAVDLKTAEQVSASLSFSLHDYINR